MNIPGNGLTKTILFLIAFGAVIFAAEDRYARAGDMAVVQSDVSKVIAAMKAQHIARKTALELKKAREGLSPEEEVELQGLKDIIKALNGG